MARIELVVVGEEPVGVESARPRRRASAALANGMLLASRLARVRAMLIRIRKIQVRSEDRPSKRSIPSITAIQVSWTISSATASVWA